MIEQIVQKVPYTLSSVQFSLISCIIVNILLLCKTFVIIDWYIVTKFLLELSRGGVRSLSLDKGIKTRTCHYGVPWNNFTALSTSSVFPPAEPEETSGILTGFVELPLQIVLLLESCNIQPFQAGVFYVARCF